MTPEEVLKGYLSGLEEALRALPVMTLRSIASMLWDARRRGSRVFIIGNGGSAATASHLASDLSKTTLREDEPRLRAIALTDNVPLITAWANDTGYENTFAQQLENLAMPGDVLIAISGSGRSENILKAVRRAREMELATIGLTGAGGGQLKDRVDIALVVASKTAGQIEDLHLAVGHMLAYALAQAEA